MIFNVHVDCHWEVDPEPFYQDCLYDTCSCETKVINKLVNISTIIIVIITF